jgi:DNA primase
MKTKPAFYVVADMSGMFGEARQSKQKSVEWYTPAWVFDALGLQFDLDPASPHDFETAVPAACELVSGRNAIVNRRVIRGWSH